MQKNIIDTSLVPEGLKAFFNQYEVPIGLLTKLSALSEFELNMMIDDSGSMSNISDVNLASAGPFMKEKLGFHNGHMTRWQEVEDRLHCMMDILSYIPTKPIKISFFNRDQMIVLSHENTSPEAFAKDAHAKITAAFTQGPAGGTPILTKLKSAFKSSLSPTMHYLFTDGEPSDGTIAQITDLVKYRENAQQHPITFLSCTNDDAAVEWIKDLDEVGPYTAELDDFASEKREVLKDQGPGFSFFSKGFWMVCELVAALNPDDLDAIDESKPFSKITIDNLLGRELSAEEYRFYFNNNPNARPCQAYYNDFLNAPLLAREILQGKSLDGRPLPYTPQYAGIAPSAPPAYLDDGDALPKSAKTKGACCTIC